MELPDYMLTEVAWKVLGRGDDGSVTMLNIYDTFSEAEIVQESAQKERSDLRFEIQKFERIIPDRTLPTELQVEQLILLMHHAFLCIRRAAKSGRTEHCLQVSEIFLNMPKEMRDNGAWDWNLYEREIRQLSENHSDGYASRLYPLFMKIRHQE